MRISVIQIDKYIQFIEIVNLGAEQIHAAIKLLHEIVSFRLLYAILIQEHRIIS